MSSEISTQWLKKFSIRGSSDLTLCLGLSHAIILVSDQRTASEKNTAVALSCKLQELQNAKIWRLKKEK